MYPNTCCYVHCGGARNIFFSKAREMGSVNTGILGGGEGREVGSREIERSPTGDFCVQQLASWPEIGLKSPPAKLQTFKSIEKVLKAFFWSADDEHCMEKTQVGVEVCKELFLPGRLMVWQSSVTFSVSSSPLQSLYNSHTQWKDGRKNTLHPLPSPCLLNSPSFPQGWSQQDLRQNL